MRHLATVTVAGALAVAVGFGTTAYAKEPVLPQANDPWFVQGQERLEEALKNKPILKPAKNVILFIGDGMGVSTVTAARIFQGQTRGQTGEENFLPWEKFPHAAFSKTYNTNQQTGDSAGTATALNSGIKSQAGMISGDSSVYRGDCDSMQGHVARTTIELAEMAGMATGTVTTTRLTHATPAASYAHSPDRDFEDDSKAKVIWQGKGCKDIASQLIEFPYGDGLEVALGGGRRHFIPKEMKDPENPKKTGKRLDGRDLAKEWVGKYDNSAYVWNQEQFDAIDPAKTDHLLGLFNSSHMQYEADRMTKDKGGEPSLAQMTGKAIDILARNPKGFFLQVEGGRIDHAHHDANAYRALTDTVAFADAVDVALKKVDMNDTLVIVTVDHSHVFVISGYPTRGNPILGKVIFNSKKGGMSEGTPKLAKDGKPWTTVGYYNGPNTPKNGSREDITNVNTEDPNYTFQAAVPLGSDTHGGEDVPVWAKGPGAWLIQGTVEQNYLFHVIDYALSLRQRATRATATAM
jgi:alkaline phosphatase